MKVLIVGITIHYTITFKGNVDSLNMMIERAIDRFKKIQDTKISGIMDTGMVEIKGDFLSIEENNSIVEKLAMQGVIDPGQASWFFCLSHEEKMNKFQVIGFSTLFGGDCSGCEPFNLAFLNKFQDKGNTWKAQSFTKTEWANDFVKAHTQIIGMINILRYLGCIVHINDEGGYWGSENLDTLKSRKKESEDCMNAFVNAMEKKGLKAIPLKDIINQNKDDK